MGRELTLAPEVAGFGSAALSVHWRGGAACGPGMRGAALEWVPGRSAACSMSLLVTLSALGRLVH